MAAPMDFAVKPPQVLWYELMAGDQAASMTMAATAHQVLADLIQAEAAQMGLTTTSTAAGGWQGAGGLSMLSSAGEFIAAMELLMAWLQDSSQSTLALVDAYHTAQTTMVPGPVSDANRVSQAGFVATNWFGQNFPAIHSLDFEYGRHWVTNAGAMAAYQSVLLGLLGLLGIPPPIAPAAANPAAAAADAATGAAQSGTNAGMQGASHGTQEAGQLTGGPAAQAAAAPAEAGQGLASAGPMLMGQLGQMGQLAGQVPQMAGQLPAMLGQMPQMAMGMLGPLASGFSSMGAGAGVDPAAAATISQASLPPGGLGAGGAGGGGGGIGAGGAGVVSSFTRPASSFSAPSPPKLPSGWSSVVEPPAVAGATQPMAGGTGGLYGAPMAMNAARGEGTSSEKPARTMQLTGHRAGQRGDGREN